MRLKFVSSQLPNFSCKRVRTECLKGFKHSSAATFMVSPREGGVNHTVEPTFCPIPLMGFSSVKSSGSSAETRLENATTSGIIFTIKDRITIRQKSPPSLQSLQLRIVVD